MKTNRNLIKETSLIKSLMLRALAFVFAMSLIFASPAQAVFFQQYVGNNPYSDDAAGPRLTIVPLVNFPDPIGGGTVNVDAQLLLGTSAAGQQATLTNTNNTGNLAIVAGTGGAGRVDITAAVGLFVNGVQVPAIAPDSNNTPNTLVLRDAAGSFAAGTITAATGFTGTLLTAAQPNVTSLGTLTGLTVSGTTTLNNLNVNAGSTIDFNANELTDIAAATAATSAVTLGQMNTAIAAAGGTQFLAAGSITMPADGDTTNPGAYTLDTTTATTFPLNGLNGATITAATITNTIPQFKIDFVNNTVRAGSSGATLGTAAAPVALPTLPEILIGVDPNGAGQYIITLIRAVCAPAACNPATTPSLDMEIDFDGTP